MSWVSLSVHQTCNSFRQGGLGDPFVHQGWTCPNSDSWQYHGVLCRHEGWHTTLLLWLGMLIIWWNLFYLLANYQVGFWTLKSGVSQAGNLSWFLRTILKKCFPLFCSPSDLRPPFPVFWQYREIGQDAEELVVMAPLHLKGSFHSRLSQLTMQSPHVCFFVFCHCFPAWGWLLGLGKHIH